jgi:ribosomal protein S18 acetylase RimI-like enzyme/8-oxo-dGTP pyrophosphatase MutT (NUDIX family)
MRSDAAPAPGRGGRSGAEGIVIRRATAADGDAIWRIFHAVVATGDTYAFAEDTPREVALDYFLAPDVVSFVAEIDGVVVAMYKLIPNRPDRGAHVANASFMVDPDCKGRGIGWMLGRHSLAEAWARGYLSMQFNFVVSTNTRAVELWQRLGFTIVGRSPRGFRHRELGDVDALVMYRSLDDPNVGDAMDVRRFGEPAAGQPYVVRPSAFVIVSDGSGAIALVRTGEGVFLPGGGVEPGESAEAAARRETREECAFDVVIGGEIGRAAYLVHSRQESTCFEKRSLFFYGARGEPCPSAPEHEVLWVASSDALERITRPAHRWALEEWGKRAGEASRAGR